MTLFYTVSAKLAKNTNFVNPTRKSMYANSLIGIWYDNNMEKY